MFRSRIIILLKIAAIFLAMLVLGVSCSSSKQLRKCNGEKGVQVPMGTL